MGRRSEHTRRLPCLVLSLEKAPQLLVRDLDAEVRECLADHARILDLFQRPRDPEQGLELLAEVRANVVGGREVVLYDRRNPLRIKRKPFVVCAAMPDAFQMVGISVVESLASFRTTCGRCRTSASTRCGCSPT